MSHDHWLGVCVETHAKKKHCRGHTVETHIKQMACAFICMRRDGAWNDGAWQQADDGDGLGRGLTLTSQL